MQKPKTIKKMMVFCEPCSFKMILENDQIPENLVEIKTSMIPGGIPELDSKTGKTKLKPQNKQNKRYKCPKCGRGLVTKELQGAYLTTIKQIEQKAEIQKMEEDRKKRLEDGKPFERSNENSQE
jgi:hypothetical protein